MISSTRRRIVMLLPNNPYPQDERVHREAECLVEDGYHVTVVCPRSRGQSRYEIVDGVAVRRFWLPVEGSGPLSYLTEYATVTLASLLICLGLLLRRRLDVVHVHNPPDTLVLVAGLVKLFGKQFVFDHHDLAPELYEARFGSRARPVVYRTLCALENRCCRWADHVITTNESYRRLEQARDGISADRITVVRNGSPLEEFEAARADDSVRDGAEILVCYAGAMGPQDGVDYLVRAMGYLVTDLGRRDIRCHLLGDGDAAPSARALVHELGLDRYVRFTGWLVDSEYLSHLAAADIGVEPAPSNPYNDRSTTIKILEYMALGKPVVAFDLPEHRVSADGAAIYVAPNDENAMAKAIATLADQPEQRARMSEIGRQRTREQLSWAHSAPNLLRVYRSLAVVGPAT
jgi:glycosyltransferase involved in cell wall biosynthesis